LGLDIPMETKYQNIKKYLIDFMVIAENLLTLGIKFLHLENLAQEEVILLFNFLQINYIYS
jgi:hypothetical protein